MNTMPELTKFANALQAETDRVIREWDGWDGTPEHAEQINDRQCARLNSARLRCGVTSAAYIDSLIVEQAMARTVANHGQ